MYASSVRQLWKFDGFMKIQDEWAVHSPTKWQLPEVLIKSDKKQPKPRGFNFHDWKKHIFHFQPNSWGWDYQKWNASCERNKAVSALYEAVDTLIDESDPSKPVRKALVPSDSVPFPWCDDGSERYEAICRKFRPEMETSLEIYVQAGPTLVCIHISDDPYPNYY
eukprot:TRINITY_DN2017_c0_g1_i1.p1 TRINITY_DN2017_c0_g1~~TRINITY_DN2017_c0_g1_i1.p1  ORF type:complete len:165 (+),score=15.07 TRINITY_DN2017_c0_g1_i1:340-834(+)